MVSHKLDNLYASVKNRSKRKKKLRPILLLQVHKNTNFGKRKRPNILQMFIVNEKLQLTDVKVATKIPAFSMRVRKI